MSDATDRLERSRAALTEAMRRGGVPPPRRAQASDREHAAAGSAQSSTRPPGSQGHEQDNRQDATPGADDATPPWHRWLDAARRRWQSHPLHLVLEIAGPALGAWAARRPWAFLAVAALAGAGIVAARPWRSLSLTGIGVLALRGLGVPSFALSGLRWRRRAARRMATP